jgi:hypothetical protein
MTGWLPERTTAVPRASVLMSPPDRAETASGLRDPRRRGVGGSAWFAVVVVVAAAVGVVAVSGARSRQAGYPADAPSGPMTEAQVAAQCRETLQQLNGDTFGEPVQRLVARNGDSRIRVYVAGRSKWISVCRSGRWGEEETFGTVMEPGRADRIRLFGGEDSVLKANLLLGHLPKGAATIKARLPSGQIVTGAHDGDIFLVWAPGASVRGARLTAARSDGSVVDTAAAPGAGV